MAARGTSPTDPPPGRPSHFMLARLLLNLLVVLAIYWTLLFLAQRQLLFPRPPGAGAPDAPAGARTLWLESPAGRTEAWYLPPFGPSTGPVPVLLFGHGNAELINHWPGGFDEPRRWGMGVLLVEYPGYGRSGGTPASRSIQQAFESAYDWAAGEPGIDAGRIVGYGRSLGGGAVSGLSRTRRLAGLILESSFTNTTAFAWRMGAPPFLVRDRFDNLAAVRAYRGPRLILHGARDEVIPTRHGEQLAEAAGVELVRMPCGHNDCPRPWREIGAFLLGNGLVGGGDRAGE